MTTRERLLADIEAFLAKAGMSAATFGRRAVNDTKIVGRLRNGAEVTLGMADRLRAFMEQQGKRAD